MSAPKENPALEASNTTTAVPSPNTSMDSPNPQAEAGQAGREAGPHAQPASKLESALPVKIPHVTLRTVFMAILVAMGGFIFGYDTGEFPLGARFLKLPNIYNRSDLGVSGNAGVLGEVRRARASHQTEPFRISFYKCPIGLDCCAGKSAVADVDLSLTRLAIYWYSLRLPHRRTACEQDWTKMVHTAVVRSLLHRRCHSAIHAVWWVAVGWHCDGTLGSGARRGSAVCLSPVVHG